MKENLPAAHPGHMPAPSVDDEVPAGHAWQDGLPMNEKVPAGHNKQVELDAPENLPDKQDMQTVLIFGVYFPGVHEMQYERNVRASTK
jgi:hypothetical protein